MEVTQKGQKCIFILCMEVTEEDVKVQEEIVTIPTLPNITRLTQIYEKVSFTLYTLKITNCTPYFLNNNSTIHNGDF